MQRFSSRLPAFLAAAATGVLALALLAPSVAQAQTPPGPPPGAMNQEQPDMQELRLDLLTAQLGLTDEQRTEVETVLATQGQRSQRVMQQYRPQMQEVADDSVAAAALRDEMAAEMETVQEETDAQLAEVLDADQMASYRVLSSPPEEDADPIDSNLEQLDAQLGFTSEQRSQLRPVLRQQMDQMESLRQRIQQAGQDQQQRQQIMQEAQQMRQDMQTELESILDDEQLAKLDTIRQKQQQIQQAQRMMRQRQMQRMRQMQQQQGGDAQGGGMQGGGQ